MNDPADSNLSSASAGQGREGYNHPAYSFHIMSKPIGPICNLDCKYCFYLEKERLYRSGEPWRMSDEVLESFIRQYIQQQGGSEINFAWQGGEPTLLGLDYFRKIVSLQDRLAGGKRIHNALQTNGTLLDDAWCEFFTERNFLIGLSIDGPRALHDCYRVDKNGRSTFDAVMRGLELLRKHQTQFNTLTVVHRGNSDQPLEVYRFLKQIGSRHLQFIPLVERQGDALSLAGPPVVGHAEGGASRVADWSVQAKAYGTFLCAIYDQWVRHDVGQVFVQLFDSALGSWVGQGASLCIFAPTCGRAMAMEHDGDIFACDHYVYPEYRLGNLLEQPLVELAKSPQQVAFGNAKRDTLPQRCRECPVLFACNGGCPKHRFIRTPSGEPGLNYLCEGYRQFFQHIDPTMRTMAKLLRSGRSADGIMGVLARPSSTHRPDHAGRNDPCPCGSGRKYKKCCGA